MDNICLDMDELVPVDSVQQGVFMSFDFCFGRTCYHETAEIPDR